MIENLSVKNQKIFKFSYTRLIILILVALGIYLLIPKLVGLKEGIKLLHQVKAIYIILGILGQLISYTGAAWLLKLILKRLHYRLKFSELIRISSIGAFAIHFFPLAGAGEAAINYYILRNKDVSAGDTLFTFIIRSLLTYLGFFLFFALGLLITPIHPHLTINQKIVSIILFIMIVSMTFWVRYLFQHREKFWRAGRGLLRAIDWLSRKILRKKVFTQEKIELVVSDVYEGFRVFSQKKGDWLPATGYAAIYWLGDIWTLFFALLAFGYLINPGIMIVAYCLATLAGLLSFIPGGLGVLEGVMSLTLISMGVPATIALFSVLLYRLISFWLLMPAGFVSFLTLQSEITNNNQQS